MKKKKQIREIEKANAEIENPKNIDFVEISMPHEELDKVAHKYAYILEQRNDPILRQKTVKRQQRLLKKIFKVAAQVLTDDQFNIFTSAYAYQIPDTELAKQLGVNHTHITQTLRRSVVKIQKRLRVPVNLKYFSRGRKKQDEEE